MAALEGDRHAVVFDVNVYLDVARILGPPFSWKSFDEAVVAARKAPVPHPSDRRLDSLRAIAVSASGRFAGRQSLEVWTSDHIADLIEIKAAQPTDGETPELTGLGWSASDARGLLVDLHDDLVWDMTGGASVGEVRRPDGTPPLSHEDGCVFTTARRCATDDPDVYYHRYLVTCDTDVLDATLPSDVEVLSPGDWVLLVRRLSADVLMASMRPKPEA